MPLLEPVGWRRLLQRAKWVLLLVIPLWVIFLAQFWDFDTTGGTYPTDAFAYHRAARAVELGLSIYDPLPPAGPHTYGAGIPYLYPPPFAAALALVIADFEGLYQILLFLGLAGLGMLCWGIARLSNRGWAAALLVAGILFAVELPAQGILAGNIQMFVDGVAIMALTLSAAPAVALLATAAILKVTPAWPLTVVLIRTRRFVPALAIVVIAGALCLGVLGTGGSLEALHVWFTAVVPSLSQDQFDSGGTWYTANVSPAFAPLFVLLPEWPVGVPLPGAARLYLAAVQLAVPLSTAWLTRRRPWNEQAAWVFVAATVSAPILRPPHLSVLLIVPALLVRAGRSRPRTTNRELLRSSDAEPIEHQRLRSATPSGVAPIAS